MRLTGPALALLLALPDGAAQAAPTCQASVSMVDFGRVDEDDGGDITGRLTVACDGPGRFEVEASSGYGSFQRRFMRGPKGTVLYYNLYVDPARRRVWGDGEASGTARIVGRSDGRKPEDFTIYGRIPDRQPARSGTYSDAVKVTVAR